MTSSPSSSFPIDKSFYHLMLYGLSVVKQQTLATNGGEALVPRCGVTSDQLPAIGDTIEAEAFPSWLLPTLNRHQWEEYWFAASGSAYASNIFTADTEKRNWIGSICLVQFKAHICFPYSRFEIFKTVEPWILFFLIVTSHSYKFFRGIIFFELKFGSEARRSRFVRNVCSHLDYDWHKWSRPTHKSNYTRLEKSIESVNHGGRVYTPVVALVENLNYK